ncbi:TetR/AcrR family transcriptional regulator [Halalkalibacter sp. APA_J-10(15)]|uniref:TetR/AcrR family transcriptional regulator n=1 Tax=Halalkalibacter sp. APA_J-10(15) TaxID=2933805 RepID=UPI001FF0E96B|nr:TetR/AcrR family transcriptional regulator [Halalkalibacter sp. APA_J-10(15)]MCK0470068.1 TetR/AcrR family transcriptional regulator [Halalkalibacter sp. APA_J-10(15)]
MKNKETKREQILKAAFHVFLRDGYERATMQEVAEVAGVGKGTTYEYFSSKEALLFEVVQKGFGYFLEQLLDAIEQPGTVREKVERLFLCNLNFFQQEVKFRDFMLNDFGKMPDELHKWLLEKHGMFIGELAKVIREGQQSGEVGPVHPEIVASTLIHSLKMIYFYPETKKETRQEIVRTQVEYLFQGLAKRDE